RTCVHCGFGPGVVGYEAPHVSFQVAATEAATTIILVLQLDDDLRACGLRLGVKRIGAVDHHVDTLRRGAADFVRLALLARESRIGHRAEHQHAVSERQLCVGDACLSVLDDPLALKVEGPAQPLQRTGYITITQTGNQVGRGVLAGERHGGSWLAMRRGMTTHSLQTIDTAGVPASSAAFAQPETNAEPDQDRTQ